MKLKLVEFEVLTAVVMKVAIFWDIAPYSPYITRRFGGTYHLHPYASYLKANWFLARLIFDPEAGGDTFLQNISSRHYIPEDGNFKTKTCPGRPSFSHEDILDIGLIFQKRKQSQLSLSRKISSG
jgi:hypothetical protein